MAKEQHLDIQGTPVKVTNLDKQLYPAAGWTKSHVLDYYIRVAPFMLPHLKDRPVTLKRYPDGVQGEFFFEKDAPRFTPKWVQTAPVPRRTTGGTIRYVLINDLRTLVWCANLASLELHPFLHRAPKIDRPTSVVFDLDPGEGTDILTCAEVAFLLKDVFDGLGLQSFAKVSGSKGLQIYVPLNTAVTYAVTQPFAHGIAELMEQQHKGLVVSEMAKVVRKNRVFIDWSQNSDFKTTIGVYSLRAKSERPFVSMPVTWKELRQALDAQDGKLLQFEPEAALQRLEKAGDLFAPGLTTKQKLPTALPQPKIITTTEFIEPMQAKLVGALPEGDGWLYEIKLDGYRALASKQGGAVTLTSRNAKDLGARFPGIVKAIAGLPDGTVLDGEVVAFNDAGRPSFQLLQNTHGPNNDVYYYAFDILEYQGRSLLKRPLSKRREVLREALSGQSDPLRLSETLTADAQSLVRAAREQGLEGLVAKRANSLYEPGQRSGAWVKFKVNRGQELVVGGYKPGSNGFDNLLVGYYDGDRLLFAAKIKNGFDPAIRREIFGRLKQLEIDECPFANLPERRGARRGEPITAAAMKDFRWVRPELVAQIEFTEWTEANNLRHSRFVALRDDKDPRAVGREAAIE